MSSANNSLYEAFAGIIKPVFEEAIRQALNTNSRDVQLGESADKAFLTIKSGGVVFRPWRFHDSSMYPKEATPSPQGWASSAHQEN